MAEQKLEEVLEELRLAEQEKTRLERKRAQLEQESKRLAARLIEQDSFLQPTKFLEHLKDCHDIFSDRLNVECDPTLATGGFTSDITNHTRPVQLKYWTGYPDLRAVAFEEIKKQFQTRTDADQRTFASKAEVRGQARYSRDHVSGGIDIPLYHYNAVKPFAKEILQRLIDVTHQDEMPGKPSTTRARLGLGTGISFGNHANTVTKSKDADAKSASRTYADQLCVKHEDSTGLAAAVIGPRPPHKATKQLITAGLHAMNVEECVLDE